MMTTFSFRPLDPAFLADPYETYERLRNQSPVHYIPELDIWCVSRHEDVVHVLSNPRTFSSELGLGSGWTLRDDNRPTPVSMNFQAGAPGAPAMLGADAPDHERLRRPVSPAFGGRMVRAVQAEIDEHIDGLLDRVEEAGRHGEDVDLVTALSRPLPARAIRTLTGLPASLDAELAGFAEGITGSWDPTDPRSTDDGASRVLKGAWDLHRKIVATCKGSSFGEGTAIGRMAEVHAAAPEAMSTYEIVAAVSLIVMAGYETTSCAIANALDHLMNRPDLHRTLTEDRRLISTFVDETIRLESPVQATWRGLTDDIDLADTLIPKGSRLMVLIGSANRDERHFENPDTLQLGRRDGHVGFGHGIHSCIGGLLARTEVARLIERLIERSIHLVPRPGSRRTTNLNVRGFAHLPARAAMHSRG